MKTLIAGGGPAGLYAGILLQKADPSRQIAVLERGTIEGAPGFGVVFSDSTLDRLREHDEETHAEIVDRFERWSDLEIHHRGRVITSSGHRFAAICRRELLNILARRARRLGVEVRFESAIASAEQLADAELIIAADGMNSQLRRLHQTYFQPQLEAGANQFIWLGTTLPLRAFTFLFKWNQHGLWRVHAYRYHRGRSAFIVECRKETLMRAGLADAGEAETIRYLEQLFAEELAGHSLIGNRSAWRSFPVVKNEKWCHENIVLIGDAAHTLHFSIGSGTKVAMEDAIALAEALREKPTIPAALASYEAARKPVVDRLQGLAEISRRWFEDTEYYTKLDALELTMNLLTRTHRLTYETLRGCDRALIARVERRFAGAPIASPLEIRNLQLPNRIVDTRGDLEGAGLLLGEFSAIGHHAKTGFVARTDFCAAAERAASEGHQLLELRVPPASRWDLPEIIAAVRRVWPESKPIAVHISGTHRESTEMIALAARSADLLHLASISPELATRIRLETGLPVILTCTLQEANTHLSAGRADLCAISDPEELIDHA